MLKSVLVLFIAGIAGSALAQSFVTVTEDFNSNPASRWKLQGDSSAFNWNAQEGKLQITWDSSKPKSLFYLPLTQTLSRSNSFSFEFDLQLEDIVSGHVEGKTGPMQIGVGLLNMQSTNDAWSRTDWGSSSNVFEFNCYPSGSYPGFNLEPTTSPGIVSSSGVSYAPMDFTPYLGQLPLGQVVHISMQFDASRQMLTAAWTTNGVLVGAVHELSLSDPSQSQFGATDDFALNMFSISSYKGNDWDSVLAHGSVDNVRVTIPSEVLTLAGGSVGNAWQGQVRALPGWTYRLERSKDLRAWDIVEQKAASSISDLSLTDAAPPADRAYYRVQASR